MELKEILLTCPNFVHHIRQYISAMAFASFLVTRKEIPGRGPYCFKRLGQIHPHISDLIPTNGKTPSYGQLCFIDSSLATDTRFYHSENMELNCSVLSKLENILANNSYAQAYKTLADTIKFEPERIALDFRFIDNKK